MACGAEFEINSNDSFGPEVALVTKGGERTFAASAKSQADLPKADVRSSCGNGNSSIPISKLYLRDYVSTKPNLLATDQPIFSQRYICSI